MPKVQAHIGQQTYKTQVEARTHHILADEPLERNGGDLGFTPTELLSASLASCTAITLKMYVDRKEWLVEDIWVEVDHETTQMNQTQFRRRIQVHAHLDDAQLQSLLKIANACPVHKLLSGQIEVSTQINQDESRTV